MPLPRRLPAIRFRPLAVSFALVPAVAALAPAAPGVAAASRAPSGSEPALTIRGTGTFEDVAASSRLSAWAVGGSGAPGSARRTLIAHWNGTTWRRVPSPSPKAGASLYGVAVTPAHKAWAVGGVGTAHPATLIEHWNGRAWSRVPSPSPGGAAVLYDVVATGTGNAWAVGFAAAALDLPEGWEPMGAIGVGHAAAPPSPRPDRHPDGFMVVR